MNNISALSNTKTAAITKKMIPSSWHDFDGEQLEEFIEFEDGTELEIRLTLTDEGREKLGDVFREVASATVPEIEDANEIHIDITSERPSDTFSANDELYVIVGGEDDCPEYCHRDLVDVYIECMSDPNLSVTEEEVEDATSQWIQAVKSTGKKNANKRS